MKPGCGDVARLIGDPHVVRGYLVDGRIRGGPHLGLERAPGGGGRGKSASESMRPSLVGARATCASPPQAEKVLWREAPGKLAVGHASRAAAPELRGAERELNAVYVEAIAAAGTAGRAAAEAVAASRRLQADACVRVGALVEATATCRTRRAEVEIALPARWWAGSGSRRRRSAETTRPLVTLGPLEESVLVRVQREA